MCVWRGVKEGDHVYISISPTNVLGSVDDTDVLPKCGHTAPLEHLHDSQGCGRDERRLP